MPSRLVSPVLVGRERELTRLAAAYDRAAAGEPSVVLVVGEAGVGKSRLVADATARAEAAGARVLAGGCVELGGEGMPFVPIVDALRLLARTTPPATLDRLVGHARRDLARLLPELDPDEPPDPTLDAGATSRLFEHVLGLVGRLGADQPLVLVVEDVHWADRSTLDLLAFVVRALRTDPVLVVATYRAEDVGRHHPLRRLLGELERQPNVERVELGRFTPDEVGEQLRGILGEAPSPDVVRRIYERSEGNAFFVEELLAALEDGAASGSLPPGLRDVLLTRVEGLAAPTPQVLQAASASGQRVGHRLLATVAGLGVAELDQALRDAVDHRVLTVEEADDGYAFRHALVREAVYDDMLPSQRVRLHVAYGEALERDPTLAAGGTALAAMLAHHWYAAHDVTRALPASVEAGRHAAAAYAYAEAAQHFERALETWPQVEDAEARTGIDLVDLLELTANATSRHGDLHRTTALLDEALSLVDREEEPVRAALLLARRARPQWDLVRGAVLDDLYEAVSLIPEGAPERGPVLGSLAATILVVDGDLEKARRYSAEAAEAARASGDTRNLADALATLGPTMVYSGDRVGGVRILEEAASVAREAGDPDIELRVHVNLCDSLATVGRLTEALDVARRGTVLAAQVGLSRTTGLFVASNLAEVLLQVGEWDEAEVVIDGLLSLMGSGAGAEWAEQMRAELAIGRGDWKEAERRLVGRQHAMDSQTAQRAEGFLAQLAVAEGRLHDARRLLTESLSGPTQQRYTWPQIALAMRVEADIAQQARDRGAEPDDEHATLLDRFTAAAAALPDDLPSLRGYVSLTEAERIRAVGEPAADAWAAAVAAWREAGEPFPMAYALFRLAEALVVAGDRAAASAPLAEAASIAERLGAQPILRDVRSLAARARLDLGGPKDTTADTGDAAPGPEPDRLGLTDRELEVLRLVADGRSNSQIAEALYISRKTASVHVSNILAKLGLASRVEAAALAHRRRLFD